MDLLNRKACKKCDADVRPFEIFDHWQQAVYSCSQLLNTQRGALARAAVAGLADDAQDMLTSLVSMYDLMVALPNVNAAPINKHMYDQ